MRGMIIKYLPLVAAMLFGWFILSVFGRLPPKKVYGKVRDFTGLLRTKISKRPFSERMQNFLEKNGAAYHYGKKVTAAKLFTVSVLLFGISFFAFLRLSLFIALVAGVIVGALPWILLPVLNKQDNDRMLPELQAVHHSLSLQLKAGVHLSEALSEMYTNVNLKRLRDAFCSLGSDIIMNSDVFAALEDFQKKFNNRYIDSFCITVLQLSESGKASDLLTDISDQMKDMEKIVLEKKKGKLDRKITFYQLGMLVCVLAVAMYACLSYMLKSAINIG